jgi:HAMP domain-containing protein
VRRALTPPDDAPSRAGAARPLDRAQHRRGRHAFAARLQLRGAAGRGEGASGDADVVYVAIHDKEGAIAGVAGRSRAPLISPLPLPSHSTEPASFDVQVDTRDGERSRALEVVVPVRVEGSEDTWGAVRVGLSRARADADLRRIDIGLVIVGLGLALVATAIARLLSRRITAPLRQLASATDALAAGDMSHRIKVSGSEGARRPRARVQRHDGARPGEGARVR